MTQDADPLAATPRRRARPSTAPPPGRAGGWSAGSAAIVRAQPATANGARGNGDHPGDADAVAVWLRRWIAGHRGVAPEAVEADLPFEYHGIDLVSAAEMIAELGEHLDRPLSPTVLWAHPSIAALSRHLSR